MSPAARAIPLLLAGAYGVAPPVVVLSPAAPAVRAPAVATVAVAGAPQQMAVTFETVPAVAPRVQGQPPVVPTYAGGQNAETQLTDVLSSAAPATYYVSEVAYSPSAATAPQESFIETWKRMLIAAIVAVVGVGWRSVQAQAGKTEGQGNKLAAAGVALTILAGAAGPAPALAADLENGETVFQANCASCHAGGNNSIVPEKKIKKAELEQYLTGGYKVESIITQVTNGKNSMPAFGEKLGPDDIDDVANWVYNQADKW